MRITTTSITTALTFKVLDDFVPRTELALSWVQAANGNWYATDRGAAADVYESEVRLYGTESVIDVFIDAVEENRNADNHVLELDTFNDGEAIFGADVDYSGTIDATVMDMGRKTQRTLKGFEVAVRLRALSPTFSGSSALPTLTHVEESWAGDVDAITVRKYDSYTGAFAYIDHATDSGLLELVVKLSDDDMQSMRRYWATQRSSDVSLAAIPGITEPFGPRRGGSYPYTAKLLSFDDQGKYGQGYWRAALTFAEVI